MKLSKLDLVIIVTVTVLVITFVALFKQAGAQTAGPNINAGWLYEAHQGSYPPLPYTAIITFSNASEQYDQVCIYRTAQRFYQPLDNSFFLVPREVALGCSTYSTPFEHILLGGPETDIEYAPHPGDQYRAEYRRGGATVQASTFSLPERYGFYQVLPVLRVNS